MTSCFIPRLLVVFTRQLEILVTTLFKQELMYGLSTKKVAVVERFNKSQCMDCPPKKVAIVGRWPLWRGSHWWRFNYSLLIDVLIFHFRVVDEDNFSLDLIPMIPVYTIVEYYVPCKMTTSLEKLSWASKKFDGDWQAVINKKKNLRSLSILKRVIIILFLNCTWEII